MKPDIHTLTGVYAVDALGGQERTAFEHHMSRCPACAHEVAELQETAARLGTATDTAAPASLKSRVLAGVSQVRQLPPARDRQPPPEVTVLWPQRWRPWVSGTAAAASVVLAVVFGLDAAQAKQRLTDERTQAREATGQLEHLTDLLGAPDTKLVSGETTSGGAGTAVLSRGKGQVLFIPDRLPMPPADRVYQLWLIGPNGPRSAGLLGPAEQPLLADHVAHDLTDATTLALTVEPPGGSQRPTTSSTLLITLPQ